MVNIGGTNPAITTLKVPGSQVFMTIGADTYGLVEESQWDEHYAENTDPVGGSNTQCITPGAFLGEVTVTALFSTDMPKNWATLSNGDIPLQTVTFPVINTAGLQQVITLGYCRVFRQGGKHMKDQLYRRQIRILYPAPAVIT